MAYAERARELCLEGYNCCQAVFLACTEDLGLDVETRARLASSFGGGMGGMRQVCGAVSGMLMALGLREGYSAPADRVGKTAQYETVRLLSDRFKEKNGSIICRELLGLDENFKPKPPEARTAEYYKKRPCPELCAMAAGIFEDYIQEENAAK